MQFQVPQFIETEDKIIGPLTLKQFLYLAAAGGLSFACFFILKTWLWLIITLFLGVSAAALAFIKINGQPLPKILKSAALFYWKPKLYLWKKTEIPTRAEPETASEEKPSFLGGLKQQLSTSRAPIPKREKSQPRKAILENVKGQNGFEVLQKLTGEKEKARRIDYR